MIGNDIVDLLLAKTQSNWQRKGFLDKIFTKNEQQLISQAPNPEIMVWDLWSRKEAAYKIYNRQTQIRAFIPLQLQCSGLNDPIGKVVCDKQIYFTKTQITNHYIHTVAVSNIADFDRISILDNKTEIKKLNGLPFFGPDNQIVSLSHHGNFQKI